MHRTATALALTLLAITATVAPAADTPSPPAPAAPKDKLASARQLVAQSKWADAIAELKRVNDSGSADWNNLMGYTQRKQAAPDLAAAERYYDEALRLDPKHKGALEYSGELYLMKGDLAKAEARLATLEQVCSRGCEEQADLKKSIAAYKAGGKATVKTP
jgi:tetratricopeptide (TPR) repeat protein